MPAVPLIGMVVGAAASISSARSQKKQANKAADLAKRQAAVQNQANAQAQANAAERDQIARQIEADQAAQAESETLAPDVALAGVDDNAAKRRRTVSAQFNMGGNTNGSSALRI